MIIKINTRELDWFIRRFETLNKNPRPILNAVGETVVSKILLGFRSSQSPSGKAWAPLKHRKGKPLLDTGKLRRAIIYRREGNKLIAGVAATAPYGKYHQFGTRRIPARRFLPVTRRLTPALPNAWRQAIIESIVAKAREILRIKL